MKTGRRTPGRGARVRRQGKAEGGSDRQEYRGRLRFTQAGKYESDREWKRYEGTPQRDLLRLVRERFLLRSLKLVGAGDGLTVEVGPGPGRFTPLLVPSTSRLVLVDLSRSMLLEALRRVRTQPGGPTSLEGTLGDASRMPIRAEVAKVAVALGNVVGMSGDRSLAALQEVAGLVAPGGLLIIETVGERVAAPRFVGRVAPGGWRTLLRQDPSRGLPPRLSEGMEDLPAQTTPGSPGSEFQFLGTDAVARFLNREGFTVKDQMIAAPLTGGDAGLVRSIAQAHRGDLAPLLRWEESAGRFPSILRAGGHTLTCAVSD